MIQQIAIEFNLNYIIELILVVELVQFYSTDFNWIQLIQIKPISIDLNHEFNELVKSIEFEFEKAKILC